MSVRYENVLVPTDGSEGSERIVDNALAVARDHGATIHALYVVNKRLYLASEKDEQESVVADLEREGEAAVDAVAERAVDAGLETVTAIRDGVPDRDILAYVDEQDVDLVVMGTHGKGKTGPDRLVSLGSVAEGVVKESTVPVLTVRIGD